MDETRPSPDHAPELVHFDPLDAGAYWARRFQVPVEKIREATQAVGDDPAKVAAYLGRPWPVEDSEIV